MSATLYHVTVTVVYIPYSGLISGVKSFVKSSNWPSEVIFVV